MIPAETKPHQDVAKEAFGTHFLSAARGADREPPTKNASAMRASWRERLTPYEQTHLGLALLDLATSALPYVALSALIYFTLSISHLLALALAVPSAAFLVRTFIVFHDCSHGSFFESRRANAWMGISLGLLLYSPFVRWRHDHAIHHASSGDLARRGTGDIRTLTVAEYKRLPWRSQLGYRLLRNPLVMFGLGPIVAMIIGPRIVAKGARERMRHSVIGTNLALAVMVGALCWFMGWFDYLLVFGPGALLAGSIGIWLFYVQHQFEDAYWENAGDWNYADAALRGSSFLKLPAPLRFFTGNIGYHHVHHLDARIPNYNLRRAHEENPVFHDVPTLSLWDGVRAVALKLWDEDRGCMVTFSQARNAPQPQPARRQRRSAAAG
jgi:acyl-lipid omega-6 desaturase (Delta-12 desaturase)